MDRIDKLKEFLLKDPHDAFVKHALALEYVKLEDDDTARRLWEEVLERDADYVGSYYHLGKLLERKGERTLAIRWYEQGMEAAKRAREMRAYHELQAAYEDLAD